MVSNDRGRTRRLTIPLAWVRSAIGLGILGVVILSASFVDYAALLAQSAKSKYLVAQNAKLSQQFQIVESKINSLESELERIRSLATKLRMVAQTSPGDRSLRLAMGPLVQNQKAVEDLHQPMGEREVASKLAIKDSAFFRKPPLAFEEGELAVDDRQEYSSLSIRIDTALKQASLEEQGIMKLWGYLRDRQGMLSATPNMRPIQGWYTSHFGYRTSPFSGRTVMHNGVDIAASPGTPVYAPADGIVSYASHDPGYGKLISIDHGYGVVTRYGHNSRLFVNVGQSVRRGQVISAVGNTGRTTGSHLHYEVRINDMPVDPVNFMLDE